MWQLKSVKSYITHISCIFKRDFSQHIICKYFNKILCFNALIDYQIRHRWCKLILVDVEGNIPSLFMKLIIIYTVRTQCSLAHNMVGRAKPNHWKFIKMNRTLREWVSILLRQNHSLSSKIYMGFLASCDHATKRLKSIYFS